jgi:hypothetical protein
MSRQITIGTGQHNVMLPNGGHYDAGAVVVLTDEQFSQIPSSAITSGAVLDDGPSTAPEGGEVETFHTSVASAAATADVLTDSGVANESGKVLGVFYVPKANITGANTDSRTLVLVNKGSDGLGTKVVATLALVNGVNAVAHKPLTIPLSSTVSDTEVDGGEVFEFQSNHVGTSGLADPGGVVTIVHDGSRWMR